MDFKRWSVIGLCALSGAGLAAGAASCGGDDEGRVDVQGGTTGTNSTTTGTAPSTTATEVETTGTTTTR